MEHPSAATSQKLGFVNDVILQHSAVRQVGTRHFRNLQKDPQTRAVTHEEYRGFERWVWYVWVSEKLKSSKRKLLGKRRKSAAPGGDSSALDSSKMDGISDDDTRADDSGNFPSNSADLLR